MPTFYPSGAEATVSITMEGAALRVSDLGFAYREAKMVSAEMGFSRLAQKAAKQVGVRFIDRSFNAFSTTEHLAATITDIAEISTKTAHHAIARTRPRPKATLTPT